MRLLVFLFFIQSAAACGGLENPQVARAEIGSGAVPSKANPISKKSESIVFQSNDDGKTWLDLAQFLPPEAEVEYVFTAGEELFVGSKEGGLFSSQYPESGQWVREDVERNFPDERVSGVFSGKKGVYACFYPSDMSEKTFAPSGFYRRAPGSHRWQGLHFNMKDPDVQSVLELPDGAILAACRTGIYKTSDDGKTWKQVFSGGRVEDFVEHGGVLMATVWAGGALRSSDGGETWDWPLTDGGGANKIGIVGGNFAFFGMGPIVRHSLDGGKTWQRMETLVMPSGDVLLDLLQVDEKLFCTNETGVFCSSDGGKNWKLVHRSPEEWTATSLLPRKKMLNLAISGQRMFAFVPLRLNGC